VVESLKGMSEWCKKWLWLSKYKSQSTAKSSTFARIQYFIH